jgi:hypothetical protein
MKKHNVATIFLGVLFLTMIGTKGMYGQTENRVNYYIDCKIFCTIPSHIDSNTLTNADKEEIAELKEYEGSFCEEDMYDEYSFLKMIFDFDKSMVMFFLQMMMEGNTAYERDGFIIVADSTDEDYDFEYAVNLDNLTCEQRYYDKTEDNPFFNEYGNKLMQLFRVNFKKVDGNHIVLEKETEIWYDILPSGIPYEGKWVASYLYYEVIDDQGNTVVKTGNKKLFDDCMGYTSVKEIQQNTNITVYPNPTNGQLRVTGYELQENTVIEIYDVIGRNVGTDLRVCPKQQGEHIGSPQQITIDISHLANGMYFLKIDNKTIKIVKQ